MRRNLRNLHRLNSNMTVDTQRYLEFVNGVTSEQSKDNEAFVYRIQELEGQEFPTERLLTAAV